MLCLSSWFMHNCLVREWCIVYFDRVASAKAASDLSSKVSIDDYAMCPSLACVSFDFA